MYEYKLRGEFKLFLHENNIHINYIIKSYLYTYLKFDVLFNGIFAIHIATLIHDKIMKYLSL